MARRKKKMKRRSDKAISITGVAEAVMLANVGTKAAFNLSAWDWVTDGWTTGTSGRAYGSGQVSLHELVYGNYSQAAPIAIAGGSGSYQSPAGLASGTNLATVTANLQANWVPAVVQSVAIPVGFRIGKRMLRKPLRMVNKAFKMAGVRDMVKV